MKQKFNYDLFLRHDFQYKEIFGVLASRLKGNRLTVWFDEWVIRSRDDTDLAIEQGLQFSRRLILCISSAALSSEWVS